MIARALVVAVALLAILPSAAAACPVCNAYGEEESRVAFILTTVFLSALPVAMIGVGGWLIWRRIRSGEQAPRPRAAQSARVARVARPGADTSPAA